MELFVATEVQMLARLLETSTGFTHRNIQTLGSRWERGSSIHGRAAENSITPASPLIMARAISKNPDEGHKSLSLEKRFHYLSLSLPFSVFGKEREQRRNPTD